MDEEFKSESINVSTTLPQEEMKPKKTTPTLNKAVVEVLPGSFNGAAYVCVAGDGTGYLVPKTIVESVSFEGATTFSIDLADKQIKLLYNWSKEISIALPSKDEIVANVRKALWLNGAYDKTAFKKNEVQKNLMRGAFPYRIKLEEE